MQAFEDSARHPEPSSWRPITTSEKSISSLGDAIVIERLLIGSVVTRGAPPIELVAAGRRRNGKATDGRQTLNCSRWLAARANPELSQPILDDSIREIVRSLLRGEKNWWQLSSPLF